MNADDPWTEVAILVDPSRRALYEYVRRAGHPVSREEAGDAFESLRARNEIKAVTSGNVGYGLFRFPNSAAVLPQCGTVVLRWCSSVSDPAGPFLC
jgi:hypothetical protein